MKYVIKNTEQNNKKANELETKSLLYLIGMHKHKSEMDIIAIDCLNDVTGINENLNKLWDVQAKNRQNMYPSDIGEYFYTLFDNFLSEINFKEYILFVPKINSDYKIESTLKSYQLDNIKSDKIKGIKDGLAKQLKKTKLSYTEEQLEKFLEQVFIIESNSKISTYIKSLVKFKNKRIINDQLYNSVFEELRDMQSAKKNSYIEGKIINDISEIPNLNRHLLTKSIKTLIITRLLGCDIFVYSNIPRYFIPVISSPTYDPETAKDIVQDCNANLSRAFFNKHSNPEFWRIIEFLIEYLGSNLNIDIYEAFQKLLKNVSYKSSYLNETSLLYLISLIKEGIENDN